MNAADHPPQATTNDTKSPTPSSASAHTVRQLVTRLEGFVQRRCAQCGPPKAGTRTPRPVAVESPRQLAPRRWCSSSATMPGQSEKNTDRCRSEKRAANVDVLSAGNTRHVPSLAQAFDPRSSRDGRPTTSAMGDRHLARNNSRLMVLAQHEPDDRGRNEGPRPSAPKSLSEAAFRRDARARARTFGRTAPGSCTTTAKIRPQLNHDVERLGALIVRAQPVTDQDQVTGRRQPAEIPSDPSTKPNRAAISKLHGPRVVAFKPSLSVKADRRNRSQFPVPRGMG